MGESQPKDEPWRKFFDVQLDRLVYQDNFVVVFRDRKPRASSHLLVVPRYDAVIGVEGLNVAHLPLLAHMEAVAQQVAPDGPEPLVLGFHRKPLRTVPYLHLHCIRPPFTPPWQRMRYTQPPVPGLAFVNLSTVVRKLSQFRSRK